MSKHENSDVETDQIEQIVFDALRHCGMVPPITIDDVAAVEADLPNTQLPFGPSDPFDLLRKLESGEGIETPVVLPFPSAANETERNLARAAREGGELSLEVERRMAEDKAKHMLNNNDNE
jgi:hypothetical protein